MFSNAFNTLRVDISTYLINQLTRNRINRTGNNNIMKSTLSIDMMEHYLYRKQQNLNQQLRKYQMNHQHSQIKYLQMKVNEKKKKKMKKR
jgi:hypothetical protein